MTMLGMSLRAHEAAAAWCHEGAAHNTGVSMPGAAAGCSAQLPVVLKQGQFAWGVLRKYLATHPCLAGAHDRARTAGPLPVATDASRLPAGGQQLARGNAQPFTNPMHPRIWRHGLVACSEGSQVAAAVPGLVARGPLDVGPSALCLDAATDGAALHHTNACTAGAARSARRRQGQPRHAESQELLTQH